LFTLAACGAPPPPGTKFFAYVQKHLSARADLATFSSTSPGTYSRLQQGTRNMTDYTAYQASFEPRSHSIYIFGYDLQSQKPPYLDIYSLTTFKKQTVILNVTQPPVDAQYDPVTAKLYVIFALKTGYGVGWVDVATGKVSTIFEFSPRFFVNQGGNFFDSSSGLYWISGRVALNGIACSYNAVDVKAKTMKALFSFPCAQMLKSVKLLPSIKTAVGVIGGTRNFAGFSIKQNAATGLRVYGNITGGKEGDFVGRAAAHPTFPAYYVQTGDVFDKRIVSLYSVDGVKFDQIELGACPPNDVIGAFVGITEN